MIDLELRESLPEEAVIFNNPSFDNSIIGCTTDNCVVYNYNLMIEELCKDLSICSDEAIDFINYNTIRAIPYIGEHKPVIIFPINNI